MKVVDISKVRCHRISLPISWFCLSDSFVLMKKFIRSLMKACPASPHFLRNTGPSGKSKDGYKHSVYLCALYRLGWPTLAQCFHLLCLHFLPPCWQHFCFWSSYPLCPHPTPRPGKWCWAQSDARSTGHTPKSKCLKRECVHKVALGKRS